MNKFENNDFKFNFRWIKDYMNLGSLPKLCELEIDAIMGHRGGDQSHLLEENIIIMKQGVIITKTLTEDLDLPFFVNRVMEACGDCFQISPVIDGRNR